MQASNRDDLTTDKYVAQVREARPERGGRRDLVADAAERGAAVRRASSAKMAQMAPPARWAS